MCHTVSQKGHIKCYYWTTSTLYIDNVLTFILCLKFTEAYNCNLRTRSGFHAPKLVRNEISQLTTGSLVKNLACSKGHLGFLSFQTKRDMYLFKYKFVDLHKSFFYLNRLQIKSTVRPVDEIGEYLLFTVIDGGHFEFYTLKNSAHLL